MCNLAKQPAELDSWGKVQAESENSGLAKLFAKLYRDYRDYRDFHDYLRPKTLPSNLRSLTLGKPILEHATCVTFSGAW